MEQKIAQAYYDMAGGIANTPAKLYSKLDRKYPLATVKAVLADLKTNAVSSKTQQQTLTANKITIANQADSWQADLTFYSQYARVNSGYHILLNFVNCNSKFLLSYPLKNKNACTVAAALQKFLAEAQGHGAVNLIQCDDGSEFKNKQFGSICAAHDIKLLFYNKSKSPMAIAIVERMNRTIRDLISDYMSKYNTHRFIDVYPDLVRDYNNQLHSNTNMKPAQISNTQEQAIAGMNEMAKVGDKMFLAEKFKPGVLVRCMRKKELFEKGSRMKLSPQVYKVVEMKGNKVVLLDDEGREKIAFARELVPVQNKYANPFIASAAANKQQKLKQDKIIVNEKKLNKQQRALNKEGLNEIDIRKYKKQQRALKKLN